MTQLPMTRYEKSQRATKIAIYVGGAAMASFVIHGTVTAGFDEAPVSNTHRVAGIADSEAKDAFDRPSRDDAIIGGSIPSKTEMGSANPQAILPVKRVQLPSSEAIHASLTADRKVISVPDKSARELETCLLDCDTRDPLVAGKQSPQRSDRDPVTVRVEAVSRPEPIKPDRSLLQRGGDFLAMVADAPSLTIDKGKQAIKYAGEILQ